MVVEAMAKVIKTTVDIDEALWKEVKRQAIDRDIDARDLVEVALQRELKRFQKARE